MCSNRWTQDLDTGNWHCKDDKWSASVIRIRGKQRPDWYLWVVWRETARVDGGELKPEKPAEPDMPMVPVSAQQVMAEVDEVLAKLKEKEGK